MKAVMISIRPKWVEKIANGEKTVEVRKTVPKLDQPFKVYMYCTKPRGHYYVAGSAAIFDDDLWKNDKDEIEFNDIWYYAGSGVLDKCFYLNGKVVGEFVCDRIFDISFDNLYGYIGAFDYADMGLRSPELQEYAKGKTVYGLHISDLKIYDKPKELSEFNTLCKMPKEVQCEDCPYCDWNAIRNTCFARKITRPPQGWFYVEEI